MVQRLKDRCGQLSQATVETSSTVSSRSSRSSSSSACLARITILSGGLFGGLVFEFTSPCLTSALMFVMLALYVNKLFLSRKGENVSIRHPGVGPDFGNMVLNGNYSGMSAWPRSTGEDFIFLSTAYKSINHFSNKCSQTVLPRYNKYAGPWSETS